jgi:hypothetical protein
VTTDFVTTNGSASGSSDFTPTNGLLSFDPGQTNQTISVPVLGDVLSESNETFYVRLLNPTNATLGRALGRATIQDNDPLPTLDLQAPTSPDGGVASQVPSPPASVLEPASGTTNVLFDVLLSQPSGRTVTVKYATAGQTAQAGADFVAKSGLLTFAPGVTTQTISITINHDTVSEPDEVFAVNLRAPVNATLGITQAVCTITENRSPLAFSPAALPRLEVNLSERGLQLQWTTVAGERYTVERCYNLSDARNWAPLSGGEQVDGTGGTVTIVDAEALSRPQGFYRLRRLR